MKKLFIVLLLVTAVTAFSHAQRNSAPPKFALVIGNKDYTNFGSLRNPINDANAVAEALKGLGFNVDIVRYGSLNDMENAAVRLKNRLTESGNGAYGFFYYAGHGVQMDGINYLILANANIPDRSFLRERAFSVQIMLDMLNDSKNALNMVVLDACRDFPATWSRNLNRGLSVVSNPPANHIIMYATSAGKEAADGTGNNGLFTSHFLTHLKTPGIEVNEVFRRTMNDVNDASKGEQRPALYTDFAKTAYLGSMPAAQPVQPAQQVQQAPVFEQGSVIIATGSLEINTVAAGTLQITGGTLNQRSELPELGTLPIAKINAGSYKVSMRYTDGKTEEKTVEVGRNESKKLEFTYKPAPAPAPQPAPAISTGQTYKIGDKGPAGGIVFYDKGNNSDGWRYMEASPFNLTNAQWGLYEVNVSGTKTGIGEGKRNTELIIAELNNKGEKGKAAQLCMAYALNGYNDWFLPSKDEMNELYKQKSRVGITSGLYWSSSQHNSNSAWYQYFDYGGKGSNYKNSSKNVRAIRAF